MRIATLMACLGLALGQAYGPTAGTAHAATVLVTGANQGIGLEFAKQYAAAGWTVIATHRREVLPDSLRELADAHPATVTIERLDVTDLAAVDAVAEKYRGVPIDLLINNAAIVADLKNPKPQMFGTLDYPLFDTFMQTNVRGPLKVSEALLENIKAGALKKIVMISSLSGSFVAGSEARPGRIYYKTSKAALNMAMTGIAAATKNDGIVVVSLHPGGVKVEKLAAFDLPDFMPPSESVSGMIDVIARLTPDDTGKFLDWKGEQQPW